MQDLLESIIFQRILPVTAREGLMASCNMRQRQVR